MTHLVITPALRTAVRGMPPGDTSRVNHPACPAGEDRKRRLFVAATPHGWYLHCWHCGGEGFITNRLRGRAALDALEAHAADAPEDAAVSGGEIWDAMMPWHAVFNGRAGSADALHWMTRKHIAPEAVRVQLFPHAVELRLPLYRGEPARIIGYQGRQFGPQARAEPKYLTERWEAADREMPALFGLHDVSPWGSAWKRPRIPASPVFVVESFADAAYLANCGYTAVPLYGNSLADAALFQLATFAPLNGPHVIVWLDNDRTRLGFEKTEIFEKAQDLARRFNLYTRAECWLTMPAPTDATPGRIADALRHATDKR